jgi:thiol-disulfide isomerase/thioredoxin
VNLRPLAAAVLVLALAGCTSNEPLADQYSDGTGEGYISGDGAFTEIAQSKRDAPIEFSGETVSGDELSSADLAGDVYVVNFWYAGCPPCRTEAPDLKALSEEYTDVRFLGVNTTDTAANAATFEKTFGIEYPSILDAQSAAVQLAFSGAVAPNAVPTTLVVDREGRVAARISGLIRDKSILAAMIDTVLAEAD